MNRSITILTHAGYWLLYCLLLLFMWHLMTMGHKRSDFPPSFFLYYAFTFEFAVIPALISFYVFYTVLFYRYLIKKKFVSFSLFALLVSIVSSIFAQLVIYISFWQPDFHISRTRDTLIVMCIIMSINAMLNGIIGIILKGFLAWFEEINSRQRFEISKL